MYYHWQKTKLKLSHALWMLTQGVRRAFHVFRARWVVLPLFIFLSAMIYGRYITHLNFFLFIDNGEFIVHETYETDVQAAMREANIYLSNDDEYHSPVQRIQGSVAEIIIERKHYVSVFYDGRSWSVPTSGETVASILQKTEYVPQEGDRVEPSLDTRSYDNMEIRVWRTDRTYEYETETIDFETVTKTNKNLNEKTRIVVQEGVPGQRTLKYEITREEGVVVDRALVETVTVEAVDEIIEAGLRKTVTMKNGTVLTYSRKLECVATAYTTENKTRKVNAMGKVARVGTIAVDRTLIPLGSKVYVVGRPGTNWEYGVALCEDVGGFRGYQVDLYYDTRNECMQFGRRKCLVYVLE